jgi:hypothetical protein
MQKTAIEKDQIRARKRISIVHAALRVKITSIERGYYAYRKALCEKNEITDLLLK